VAQLMVWANFGENRGAGHNRASGD